ncbi:MAG: phosphomethylpyrimidine kinase [Methanospirillaceae archaeon]|nr:phosphomethylpyrimidine kinase [Methanospirillaceae archaeon]
MKRSDLAEDIDMYGRMMIALMEIEACRELVLLIPEVRTNLVFTRSRAESPSDVLAIDGRITVINGMPRSCGRISFFASDHLARFLIELKKHDPSVRAGINISNVPGFSDWLISYCNKKDWICSLIDRGCEPADNAASEGSTMQWRAAQAVSSADGRVPQVICDSGGIGKEPVCILVGNEPVGVARDVCEIARMYAIIPQT